MHRLRVALAGVLLCACATVSQRPEAVEAPASRSSQIAAQSAAQGPAAHRYKTKIAVARFTNESNYGRSLLSDEDLPSATGPDPSAGAIPAARPDQK